MPENLSVHDVEGSPQIREASGLSGDYINEYAGLLMATERFNLTLAQNPNKANPEKVLAIIERKRSAQGGAFLRSYEERFKDKPQVLEYDKNNNRPTINALINRVNTLAADIMESDISPTAKMFRIRDELVPACNTITLFIDAAQNVT